MTGHRMPFILASASPARLTTLRAAGIDPVVRVSGVDESAVIAPDPEALVCALAARKADAVLREVGTARDLVLVGCDSVLDVEGRAAGKPGSDPAVRELWSVLRGRQADLVTGHHVVVVRDGEVSTCTRAARTTVTFAAVSDAEIEAYIATGEPQQVAGGFTIDGRGGAFISEVTGDPHTVVGISVPLLRTVLADLGIAWTSLWSNGGNGDE
ncbi:MAG: Maf family protein [Propioniciclava sp.]